MSQNLCNICSAVDFDNVFRQNVQPTFRGSWPVSAMISRSQSCPFCGFLLSVYYSEGFVLGTMFNFQDLTLEAKAEQAAFAPRKQAGKNLNSKDSTSAKSIQRVTKLRISLRGAGRILFPDARSELRGNLPCIVDLPSDAGLSPYNPVVRCRTVCQMQADFGMMRKWMRNCQDRHSICQRPKVASSPGTVSLRLVDIENCCLVDGSTKQRYLALSYVWGSRECLQLTLSNKEKFYLKDCLSKGASNVPSTISDAFALCKQLGERYLWVDSLCIVQDCTSDKVAQISVMDEIYSCAFMTIVAAAGDALSGLPGVTIVPRRLPCTVSIGSLTLAAVPDRIQDLLLKSSWTTRGWTLQEQLLSSRLLVFTEYLVFFCCRGYVYREDFAAQDDPADIHLSEGTITRPLEILSTKSQQVPDPTVIYASLFEYASLVQEYTKRSLTNGGDIINAFQGILRTYVRVLGAFHFAMPVKCLALSLSWQRGGRSIPVRRQGTDIPSWSWASWETNDGEIQFPFCVPAFYVPLHPFELLDNNRIAPIIQVKTSVEKAHADGIHETFTRHCLPVETQDLRYINGHEFRAPLDHFIIFWTSVARFRVDHAPFLRQDVPNAFFIYGQHDRIVGALSLDPKWRHAQPELLEFALLGVHGEMLYAILIERKHGIAQRVDSATIMQEDWLASGPERTLIVLA